MMWMFGKQKEPILLKEDSSAVKQLEALQELRKTVGTALVQQ